MPPQFRSVPPGSAAAREGTAGSDCTGRVHVAGSRQDDDSGGRWDRPNSLWNTLLPSWRGDVHRRAFSPRSIQSISIVTSHPSAIGTSAAPGAASLRADTWTLPSAVNVHDAGKEVGSGLRNIHQPTRLPTITRKRAGGATSPSAIPRRLGSRMAGKKEAARATTRSGYQVVSQAFSDPLGNAAHTAGYRAPEPPSRKTSAETRRSGTSIDHLAERPSWSFALPGSGKCGQNRWSSAEVKETVSRRAGHQRGQDRGKG